MNNDLMWPTGDEPESEEVFGPYQWIKAQTDVDGITVQHEGTGCQCGDFPPIFIEWYDGKPRIIIWADINEEEPTHIIDMSGALEKHRLKSFMVSLYEDKNDKETELCFSCMAEDADHADEQALNAYPDGEIITREEVES